MSPPISDELNELVRALFEPRSLLDRVRRQDPRPAILNQIAAAGDVRVVPELLSALVADDGVASELSRTIAELVGKATPVQLSWIDERLRPGYAYDAGPWLKLTPGEIGRVAHSSNFDHLVVGLLASHPNGFVREAALEILAQSPDSQATRFFSIRVNDWVEPVAARATELLIGRLRPDNRRGVLEEFPFIVRVLAQSRRDHSRLERSLKSVLLSDGGQDALAHSGRFDTKTRRKLYELLMTGGTPVEQPLLEAALNDPDAVIRVRAIRFAITDPDIEKRAAILERFPCDDPVPAVRRLTLGLLSDLMPERIPKVFPQVLLDRTASVRSLARFIAGSHQLGLVPRTVYLEGLETNVPRLLAAAIEGVGETGSQADADLIVRFLRETRPRIRSCALRALARLDAGRTMPAALDALADDASAVRTAAVAVLTTNARNVDFEIVSRRVRSLSDSKIRRDLVRVFVPAPKWEAAVHLLEMLKDPEEDVRRRVIHFIDLWADGFNRSQTQPTSAQLQRLSTLLDSVTPLMPERTARLMKFSIKSH